MHPLLALSVENSVTAPACLQRRHVRFLLLLLLLLLLVGPAASSPRVALVIGNASYRVNPLVNPVNDAKDLAAALTSAGFEVTIKTNLSADAMKVAISEFGDALRRERGTGLFFFAGHGVQTPRGNYLLPVERDFKNQRDVELFAVEARAVLSVMQEARNPLNILILDACRVSPVPSADRSAASRGLSRMDAPSGSIIAFAAAPGQTADDNPRERNGLYTKHLIAAINTPGLRLDDVFRRVGTGVEKDSDNTQSPEEVMKLRSEEPFYFNAANSTQVASLTTESISPVTSPAQVSKLNLEASLKRQDDSEQEAWILAKNANTLAGYQAFQRAFPNSKFDRAAQVAMAALQADRPAQTPDIEVAPNKFLGNSEKPKPSPSLVLQPGQQPRAGESFRDCEQDYCPEMVAVYGSIFVMGRSGQGGESENRLYHWVHIQSDYAMGRFEVTQGQWKAVMGSNPSSFQGCGDNCPVENVSWNDAQLFIQQLSQKTGQNYRLPSEAEWEWASQFRIRSLTALQMNASLDSGGPAKTYTVGTGPLESTGLNSAFSGDGYLYDMFGNVLEWVQDTWHDDYDGAPTDGSAWQQDGDSASHVLRGYSWDKPAFYLTLNERNRGLSDLRSDKVGFRLARTIP